MFFKVKVILPKKFNEELENLPQEDRETDWWITEGDFKPDNRPHHLIKSNITDEIIYFHLHRIVHSWLIDQDISYDIGVLDDSYLSVDKWFLCFQSESDAIMFKLRWL